MARTLKNKIAKIIFNRVQWTEKLVRGNPVESDREKLELQELGYSWPFELSYGPKDPAETNFKKKMNFSELVELGPNSETIGNVRIFEKI